jgi:ankyrin repeat protein
VTNITKRRLGFVTGILAEPRLVLLVPNWDWVGPSVSRQGINRDRKGRLNPGPSPLRTGHADVNIKDSHGQTPLMLATDEDQTQIVELLKQAGQKNKLLRIRKPTFCPLSSNLFPSKL